MGIKSLAKKAGAKVANTVNKLAVLSPDQVAHVDELREQYLMQMPDPTDPVAEEMTAKLMAVCGVEIYNAYLSELDTLYSPIKKEMEYEGEALDLAHNIRYFNITKWVNDKNENSLEKLVNIYQVLSNEECNIALVFNRKCEETSVYLAVANTKNADNNVDVENYRKRLADAIRGNCPGTEMSDGYTSTTLPCFDNDVDYSVAIATNIPTEKSEKFISQTIEKLLDGIVPDKKEKEYTLVLLATPVLDVAERKLHLTDIYSALAPYASWQTQYTYSENDATNSMAMFGVNAGVSAGIQNGVNSSVSNTEGTTISDGETTGTTETEGTNQIKWEGDKGKEIVDDIISDPKKILKHGKDILHFTKDKLLTSKSTQNSVANSIQKVTSKATSTAKAITEGVAKSANLGANFGANFARSSSVTATIGKNEGITQTYTNYNIKHALELLENQMKRYEKGTALGMWDFAAYVLSEDQNVANNVAHTYLALTQGEESYMSSSSINLWRGDLGEESADAKEICSYLKELRHPLFGLNPGLVIDDTTLLVYPSIVNATTPLSGKELAYSLNFPRKSVVGLPVLECAEFGRKVVTYDTSINADYSIRLGSVFHMNHEEKTKVVISKESLSSHTFITGSTGSGKSNTVYQILNEADKQAVNFLVVEPAKGEYKHVFGTRDDVNVYGTNAKIMPLLRINPFSFDDEIHVLEHVDRLVEIFKVCWPMYAAMPAVLKNAVEKSYEDCGWNLTDSKNEYGADMYPTFADVARNVKEIIDTSAYDAENKGAYKGSLLTRLQSLTNGIYGQVFTTREIPNTKLFDENTIIDISRVGSSETKALIMGLIVLKLQEYRMSSATSMNAPLKHITVLEEAHNILKRTSTEQASESSNLTGKSVEMISNAIAEMRTYGEGFIIADQSPGLLDMSAIRNTNTKIIMRLPDQSDRELVGYAANLNDDQIKELVKLPKGVAAVYQNEWVQPILCKVNKFEEYAGTYGNAPEINKELDISDADRVDIAELLSQGTSIGNDAELKEIKDKLDRMRLDASIQVSILKSVKNPPVEPRMTKLAPIMVALFPEVYRAVKSSYAETSETSEWTANAEESLRNSISEPIEGLLRRDIIQGVITYYLAIEMNAVDKLQEWAEGGRLS